MQEFGFVGAMANLLDDQRQDAMAQQRRIAELEAALARRDAEIAALRLSISKTHRKAKLRTARMRDDLEAQRHDLDRCRDHLGQVLGRAERAEAMLG